jgi:hypothetical protein
VQVELVDSEVIAGRGRRRTLHLVRLNDAWVPAAEHPNAKIERLDTGPGTVWQRRIELELRPGTRVRKLVSEPMPEPRRDALAHLVSARKGPRRKKREIELEVGRGGELVRAERSR